MTKLTKAQKKRLREIQRNIKAYDDLWRRTQSQSVLQELQFWTFREVELLAQADKGKK